MIRNSLTQPENYASAAHAIRVRRASIHEVATLSILRLASPKDNSHCALKRPCPKCSLKLSKLIALSNVGLNRSDIAFLPHSGDFLNDYEGISGREAYRSGLCLMYFVSADSSTGKLVSLFMTPMKVKRIRF
ncbi:MAG: hypothetical protein ABI284_08635 [Nitrosospira sp.]